MASTTDIQNLYIAYFNRPADVGGLSYWTYGAPANFSAVQIAQLFSQQTEYADAFANLTTTETVNTLYKNLFNHNADPAGLAYWAGQISNGTFTIGQVAIAILSGATGSDASTVAAKLSAASTFTSKMAVNASVQAVYTRDNSNNTFGIAKQWLAGVVDASSNASANAKLDATFAMMTKPPAVTLNVNAGTTNLGTAGDDIFVTSEAALLTQGTNIIGNGGTDVLNIFTPISEAVHVARVIGIPTLNLLESGSMHDVGATFLNQFTTINDYGTAPRGELLTGTVAQTINLYQTSGTRWITLNAPHQAINQVSPGSSAVNIYASNANLAGVSIDLSNAGSKDNHLSIVDAGTASLSEAQMRNIYGIMLYASENLSFSPTNDVHVDNSGETTSLNSLTDKEVTVSQYGKNHTLKLAGIANYVVYANETGKIEATGTAGSLKVKGFTTYMMISSSVPTTIETNYKSIHSLTGTGNFTISNLGQHSDSTVTEYGTINGTTTVNTTGTNGCAFYEADGSGAVTVNLGGSGTLALRTYAGHTTTVNAVAGVNANLYLSGTGGLTVNAAKSGNLTIAGYDGREIINLAASGGGIDQISVNASTLSSMETMLVTINNFKASGADVLHTGLTASSLATISIASSDYSNMASNLASYFSAYKGSFKAGSAFIVNIASGSAAGSYMYEHVSGLSVNSQDIIVKLTGSTSNITVGDLLF